jgi:hypothetical protein
MNLLNRAPAEHPKTTGSRALENIDSKNTGRVAREQAVFSGFRHGLLAVNAGPVR